MPLPREWRTDNPANGSLDAALTRRPRLKAHHPALPYAQVPAAVAAIRDSNARPATRLGFEFLVLTAARAGEVVGATWDEVDLEARDLDDSSGPDESPEGTPRSAVQSSGGDP